MSYYQIKIKGLIIKGLIIRRAIGPRACEITSDRVVFVDPPYPPEEPREGKSQYPRRAGPSGTSFLATQKIIKKLTPQFSVFWAFLFDLRQFFDEFGAILGQFWYPLGLIFRCFLGIPVLPCFFSYFATNFKKMKNVKSAQNIAPVHRIRVSPG